MSARARAQLERESEALPDGDHGEDEPGGGWVPHNRSWPVSPLTAADGSMLLVNVLVV